jgi:hypothetical protein
MQDHNQKKGIFGYFKTFITNPQTNIERKQSFEQPVSNNLETSGTIFNRKGSMDSNPSPRTKKKPFNNNYYAYSSLYK